MAAVVREALAVYVATRPAAETPALSFIGAGASGRSDTAERHEDLLWREERAGKRAPVRRTTRKAR